MVLSRDGRRIGRVRIHEDDLIAEIPGIPEGSRVLSMHYEYEDRCLTIVLEGDELEPTERGGYLPWLGCWMPQRFRDERGERILDAGATSPRPSGSSTS